MKRIPYKQDIAKHVAQDNADYVLMTLDEKDGVSMSYRGEALKLCVMGAVLFKFLGYSTGEEPMELAFKSLEALENAHAS